MAISINIYMRGAVFATIVLVFIIEKDEINLKDNIVKCEWLWNLWDLLKTTFSLKRQNCLFLLELNYIGGYV